MPVVSTPHYPLQVHPGQTDARRRRRAGLTLLETLVALAIIATAVVLFARLYTVSGPWSGRGQPGPGGEAIYTLALAQLEAVTGTVHARLLDGETFLATWTWLPEDTGLPRGWATQVRVEPLAPEAVPGRGATPMLLGAVELRVARAGASDAELRRAPARQLWKHFTPANTEDDAAP